MNQPTTAPPAAEGSVNPPEASLTLGQAVGKAAGLLASQALSNGDRAELRRISPDAPFTPALWKVLYQLDKDGASVGIGNEARERRWATLLMGMAFCISPNQTQYMHNRKVPLGAALAKAGWSELRFVQLLRASGETLDRHVRRVAQYLASKAQSANWADVANLLFYPSGDDAERIRLDIARSYYGELYKQEKEPSNS